MDKQAQKPVELGGKEVVSLWALQEMSEDWLAINDLMDKLGVPQALALDRPTTLLDRVQYALETKEK